MGAVRKSIFSSNVEYKQAYMVKYLKSTENILINKKLEGDSLFEFVQSIKKFVINFGIKDVSDLPGFEP